MKLLRTLFVASSVLAISATALSAQAAQVSCKDGAKSKAGRGACSGHGGVLAVAKVDAKAVKADVKADAKIEKTAAKTDAKVATTAAKTDVKKTEVKTATKPAKHSKKKAKA